MINRPRGTRDIVFPQTLIYQKINSICLEILNSNNYHQIMLPTYEYKELFSGSLGNVSDIVNKEMFVFEDRKGRQLALRPEGTASVVRAVQQNKLIQGNNKPLKVYYWANMFRYERPQDGRYREFWQLGVELVNAEGVYSDCEILYIVSMIFEKLNIPNFSISINYLGNLSNRENYKQLLKKSIESRIEELCVDCKKRYSQNPLRIMDCGVCSLLEKVPNYADSLADKDENYFRLLREELSLLGIPYVVDRKLVRGLDYYTGLVFEIKVDSKAKSLAGGGRYDNLFHSIGDKSIPAVGFAIGIDRLVDFISSSQNKDLNSKSNVDILFLPMCEKAISLSLVTRKRIMYSIPGTIIEVVFKADKLSKSFKQINHYDPKLVVFIGDKELEGNYLSIKNRFSKKEFRVLQENLINTIKKEISDL